MRTVSFLTSACGNNADHAFYNAITAAQADYGVSGQTGTIGDKKEFRMVKITGECNPFDYAKNQLDLDTVKSTTDPVDCIDSGDGEFTFFGWALQAGMEAHSEREIEFL